MAGSFAGVGIVRLRSASAGDAREGQASPFILQLSRRAGFMGCALKGTFRKVIATFATRTCSKAVELREARSFGQS
jgi:hypothetical protein